jgi:hypothetical protein
MFIGDWSARRSSAERTGLNSNIVDGIAIEITGCLSQRGQLRQPSQFVFGLK